MVNQSGLALDKQDSLKESSTENVTQSNKRRNYIMTALIFVNKYFPIWVARKTDFWDVETFWQPRDK